MDHRAPRCGFAILLAITLLGALPTFAGSRWTLSGPDGGGVTRLVFDPTDPSIIYAAASNGLFRSADGGRHWIGAAALQGTTILDVAVAPSDARVVYAASAYGFYRTTDGGASWRLVNTGSFFRVAVSAQNPDVVYSTSFNGPLRSLDGGVTFESRGSGLPTGAAMAVTVDPRNEAIAYAGFPSAAGIFKTSDGGAHWAPAGSGLNALVYSVAVDPSDSMKLYAGGSSLYRSTDGGISCILMDLGVGGLTAASLSAGAGSPTTLLAGTNFGVWQSGDSGVSWSRVTTLDEINTTAVAADPSHPGTFLSALSLHVYRSSDGGATTTVSDAGLASFFTTSIATDPHDDAIVYASGPAGLARSGDHGHTWSLLTALPVTRIAVDADPSTLYAISGTVQRSTDGGKTWTVFGTGLPEGATPFFITADPRLPGTLYVIDDGAVYKKAGDGDWTLRSDHLDPSMDFVTVDPHDSSIVYAGGPTGVFKSTDGAASWAAANTGLTGLNSVGLAVDPFDSHHLFAWSPTTVFESTDAVAHWTHLTTGPAGTRTFNPYLAGDVYANAFDSVQRSADGGKSWAPLTDGLPKSHPLFAIGARGTPYLGGTSGGTFAYQFVRVRAVGK
jgi:photosystem II stability/assembly factor-like uncharacterized protein